MIITQVKFKVKTKIRTRVMLSKTFNSTHFINCKSLHFNYILKWNSNRKLCQSRKFTRNSTFSMINSEFLNMTTDHLDLRIQTNHCQFNTKDCLHFQNTKVIPSHKQANFRTYINICWYFASFGSLYSRRPILKIIWSETLNNSYSFWYFICTRNWVDFYVLKIKRIFSRR